MMDSQVIEKIKATASHRFAIRIQRSWRKHKVELDKKKAAQQARDDMMRELADEVVITPLILFTSSSSGGTEEEKCFETPKPSQRCEEIVTRLQPLCGRS